MENRIRHGDRYGARVLAIARIPIWERDFLRELIPIDDAQWDWIGGFTYRPRWQQLRHIVRCILKTRRAARRILIFSSNDFSYPEIQLLTHLLKARVLIHLSDEWGTRLKHTKLADDVDLLIRQYHHSVYREPANVVFMPLGYMTGMLQGQDSTTLNGIPPIAGREYAWGFVGNANKQNRQDVLRLFAKWRSGIQAENIIPVEVFELYKKSIFVPSPRGNVRLDCFRLYEATLAGAIPVVAGPAEEIADTFRMEREPPWIIADTWELAVEKCRAELARPELLQERQNRLRTWWRSRVDGVKTQIAEALQ